MSSPFIGEIRMFAGNFAPVGWAFCNGAIMAIADNDALYALIGTTYGGDGQTTFALPNLQSRVPVHVGPGFALGQMAGVEQVTLTTSQIPSHTHSPQVSAAGATTRDPGGKLWAAWNSRQYTDHDPDTAMDPAAIGLSGGSQPHDNVAPYLTINFIISLFGVFPSQT